MTTMEQEMKCWNWNWTDRSGLNLLSQWSKQ